MTTQPKTSKLQLGYVAALFARSFDGVIVVDGETGEILKVNRAFVRISGHAAVDTIGRTVDALGLWSCAERGDQHAAAFRAKGSLSGRVELLTTRAGNAELVMVSGSSIECASGQRLHVHHVRDMPDVERRHAEYEAILDTASIGIAFLRSYPAPRHFVHCNAYFEHMFGWRRGTLAKLPSSCMWPSPEHYQAALLEFQPVLLRGEAVDHECDLRRRDGSTFPCRLRARAVPGGNGRPDGTILLCEDITRRRQSDSELAAALKAADEASRAKSAFVATISHEIRNPLNALLGLIHLVGDGQATADRQAQYLQHLQSTALSLKGLLSDTLDLAKIEAGHLDLASRPFSLHAALGDLVSTWWAAAQVRSVLLSYSVDVDPPGWVVGDAIRVRQILSNFVSNAVKFSEGGATTIRVARCAPDLLRFEVQDSGPGMDDEAQAKLFQPFVQLGDLSHRQMGGTGLGLAISRELATRMGGRVGVSSCVGSGTTVWAELPLQETSPEDGAQVAVRPDDVADNKSLVGLRVLVADDDDINLLVIEAILKRWGVIVECVHDGHEAVCAALAAHDAGRSFDVLVTDLNMPVLDGFGAARALRERASLGRLVIIGLSGTVLETDREAAVQMGMDVVLGKPFDPEQLRATLIRHSGRDERAGARSN